MIINILVILFIVFLMIGGFGLIMPLIGGTLALVILNNASLDISMIIQQYSAGVSTFALLAIPMFIFAAEIMSFGNTANSLVEVVKAYCGHIFGGLAVTVAGACTAFGAISGSANATVVAIGKPMRTRMLNSGYDEKNTDALICSSAIIASLIPPSINMVMYCVLSNTSVGELFVAGVLPGITIFLLFAIYNYFYAKWNNIPRTKRLTWEERLHVTKRGALALGFPILIIGGIYSGLFTATEAAAASVVYALICEMLIFRTVKIRDLGKLALSTAVMTGSIFILIAVGQGFSWVIAYLQIPQAIVTTMLGTAPSTIRILLVVSFAFFIGCMFVDQIVAMLILLPIFMPVALDAGIDPVYLGVVVSVQSAIGCVTPPFGSNIFVACAAFDRPYVQIVKGLPPYLLILIGYSLLILFVPRLVTVYELFF